ncbi:RNA polymerase factor sigma-54, partial [Rhizobium johnstonii]|uniref:RNA polymerase factor sigma-54 n=1 Tax=Rhizobium johnstonii TaxID=3019933 RepID=UPI003F9BBE9B
PDVFVRASSDGGWRVELNPDSLPRVLVNQSYFSRVTKNGEDHAFLSVCRWHHEVLNGGNVIWDGIALHCVFSFYNYRLI